jgi:tight adherence protein C
MPLIAVTLMVFIGTALLLFLIMYLFVPKKTVVESRLESFAHEMEGAAYIEHPPSGLTRFLSSLGGQVPLNPREYGKYMKDLVAAGYRGEMLPIFMGVKLILLIALPVAYIMFYGLPAGEERLGMLVTALALGILGFLAPTYWLRTVIRKRQLTIFHDLPDVLDLMTVCVEAGLSMDAAILRIASDKQFRDSPLAKELRLMTQEVRAGKPREDALRDLGERTLLDDLKSFVAMLIQTEKLGTSLADALRIHSDTLRTIRRQKAEEAAAKTSVKLLFPLVFLIMPALFVVMLMPALLRLTRVLGEI